MRTLFCATGNSHKVEEISAILSGGASKINVLSAKSCGGMPHVVEDGVTFSENAILKAKALAAQITEKEFWVLADDSGLVVDALNGAPGIYSARYSGEGATDEQNNEKLLSELGTEPNRSARFVCSLALVDASGEVQIFEGTCEGEIITQSKGPGGFGYDPLFIPKGSNITFAEMPASEKNAISHRSKALEQLNSYLLSK